MDDALRARIEIWQAVRDKVERAEKRSGRNPGSVQILPVSKGKSVAELSPWLSVPDFPLVWGENYLEELERKQSALASGPRVPRWHYIGVLQSRKIASLCGLVQCLQTVSRAKEIEILGKRFQNQEVLPDLFFQVNVSREGQKNGMSPDDLRANLEKCEQFGIKSRLRGLMCLPESLHTASERELRAQFQNLRRLRDQFLPGGALSMGMSSDFEWAIEEGSDLLRLGTTLFGAR